jgi:hypothetical protein
MSEPAPAPALVLKLTLDKDGPYLPGDEVAVQVEAYNRDTDTITVSGTAPDGTTVNATAEVPVLARAEGVQLGISSAKGITFTQEAGPDGGTVFKGVVVALQPPAA